MYLIEIYKSVQGESSFAGVPCIFVRLAGCNLRCSWCDSEYTFKGGYKQSLDEVEAAVEALAPVRLVEFTGGEPMLQERELIPLMERMLAQGYTLMIETSGERPLANVPKDVHKIVDVKCPGSGEGGTFRMENLDALTKRDEVKFVHQRPQRLRIRTRLYPRAPSGRACRLRALLAGIQEDAQSGALDEQLRAGSAAAGGVAAGRWRARAAQSADP